MTQFNVSPDNELRMQMPARPALDGWSPVDTESHGLSAFPFILAHCVKLIRIVSSFRHGLTCRRFHEVYADQDEISVRVGMVPLERNRGARGYDIVDSRWKSTTCVPPDSSAHLLQYINPKNHNRLVFIMRCSIEARAAPLNAPFWSEKV